MLHRAEKPVAAGGGWSGEDGLGSGGPGRSAESPGEVRRGPEPHTVRDCEASPPDMTGGSSDAKGTSGQKEEGQPSERVALLGQALSELDS